MLPFRSWQYRRGGWIAQDREPNLSVKIVRQPKKIALIGAPSSAAAFSLGSEKAPAALRAAGIVDRLQTAGYEVIDHGDCAPRLFADDEEHRRARNLSQIVAGLNDLKLRAELAVKSGALVLVLGGDCAQAIGLLAAAYAAAGRFDDAVKWARAAIEKSPPDGRDDFERRLALYEAGQAYRERG